MTTNRSVNQGTILLGLQRHSVYRLYQNDYIHHYLVENHYNSYWSSLLTTLRLPHSIIHKYHIFTEVQYIRTVKTRYRKGNNKLFQTQCLFTFIEFFFIRYRWSSWTDTLILDLDWLLCKSCLFTVVLKFPSILFVVTSPSKRKS